MMSLRGNSRKLVFLLYLRVFVLLEGFTGEGGLCRAPRVMAAGTIRRVEFVLFHTFLVYFECVCLAKNFMKIKRSSCLCYVDMCVFVMITVIYCLSVCWSVCLSPSLPSPLFNLSIYLSIYLSTYIYLPTYLSVRPSVRRPSIHLSNYLSIYLSDYLTPPHTHTHISPFHPPSFLTHLHFNSARGGTGTKNNQL